MGSCTTLRPYSSGIVSMTAMPDLQAMPEQPAVILSGRASKLAQQIEQVWLAPLCLLSVCCVLGDLPR